ncbi:MAG: glycosyl transferase, partial [Candidatus Diapherotrites archaeon]|nr:glycosyl transferase [Candidatus Diapherotrites archaeon]
GQEITEFIQKTEKQFDQSSAESRKTAQKYDLRTQTQKTMKIYKEITE